VKLIDTDELATWLGVDASTVRRWRTQDPVQGPAFHRLSTRRTVYDVADVKCWLASRRVDPQAA
jgi:predicted DNA-binding transcriptional regulator AlpA